MRLYKLLEDQLPKLIEDILKDLAKGRQNITISLSTLLHLPPPAEKPIIRISEHAQLKMQTLVKNCTKEIAWHGLVRIEDGKYIIEDILLYPQTVTASTVNATEDYDAWLDALPDEQFNAIRMQGHSHVNMGVTPSVTDLEFYDTLVKHIRNYYIFMIMNKRGDVTYNLYDKANNKIYEHNDITLEYESTTPNYDAWYAEEYKANVKEYSYVNPVASNTFFGDFHMDDDTFAREVFIGASRTPAKGYSKPKGAKK
jgi:hypothetical protein